MKQGCRSQETKVNRRKKLVIEREEGIEKGKGKEKRAFDRMLEKKLRWAPMKYRGDAGDCDQKIDRKLGENPRQFW